MKNVKNNRYVAADIFASSRLTDAQLHKEQEIRLLTMRRFSLLHHVHHGAWNRLPIEWKVETLAIDRLYTKHPRANLFFGLCHITRNAQCSLTVSVEGALQSILLLTYVQNGIQSRKSFSLKRLCTSTISAV